MYLNINVAHTGMLRFDIVDPTVEKGYQGALEPLREWSVTMGLAKNSSRVE